jgi:hypothetical protein
VTTVILKSKSEDGRRVQSSKVRQLDDVENDLEELNVKMQGANSRQECASDMNGNKGYWRTLESRGK